MISETLNHTLSIYLMDCQPILNVTLTFEDSSGLNAMENMCTGDGIQVLSTEVPPSWSTVATTSGKNRHHSSQPHLVMAWWQQLAWTTLFTLMLIVAIGGNAIVMWIVLAHRRMRTVTNYFLVNLSVADLFMSGFNCIFNFVYMLNSNWYFGTTYCTANNFIANVSVAASVFTLTGISIDRYLAIVRPLKPRMSKLSAQTTIVVIWVASLSLGSPCLLYSTTITYKYSGQVRTACILMWPDGKPMVSTLDYVYNVIFFLMTYLLPMFAMVVCYTSMGVELWGSRSIGEHTQRQLESIRSKRKVVRMFIIIVSIFAICWLPYHAYFIYTHHNRSVTYTKYIQHLYLAFYWLAMSNAMVNPLIYYWMNARFRQYFKHVMCVWQLVRRKDARLAGAETPPMMHRCSPPSYSRSRSGTADDCHQEITCKHSGHQTTLEKPCCCGHKHHHCHHYHHHHQVPSLRTTSTYKRVPRGLQHNHQQNCEQLCTRNCCPATTTSIAAATIRTRGALAQPCHWRRNYTENNEENVTATAQV